MPDACNGRVGYVVGANWGLHIRFDVGEKGDCWVQVRRDDATGIVLFSGTIKQGSGRSFKGTVLWVRMGNPSSVKVIIEGRTAKPIDSVVPLDFVVSNGKIKRQG